MSSLNRFLSSKSVTALLDICLGAEVDAQGSDRSEDGAAIAGKKEKKMFNVVTIASECGSGGSDIGRSLAKRMGWMYLDMEIIARIASAGKLDPSCLEPGDANANAWWERVIHSLPKAGPVTYFDGEPGYHTDPDALQQLTASVFERAANEGNCVIMGRDAQCILRRHPHVLHVLVYAPLAERTSRMKIRHPAEHDLHAVINRSDSEHTRYTQRHYGQDWLNRNLYHLSLNSTLGVDTCASLIAQIFHCS
jgi:cytidylate kinase